MNRAVPLLYPSLEEEVRELRHLRGQSLGASQDRIWVRRPRSAQGRYASDAYHDFIGFSVAEPLLERAFQETYSISHASPCFPDFDRSINSYRYDVRTILPKATRVAWVLKKDDIQKSAPSATKRQFLYNLPRVRYEKEWGKNYRHPSFSDWLLAVFIRITPKIGPLRTLAFVTPTPQTETLFMASFNATIAVYKTFADQIQSGQFALPNTNLDTGHVDPPGAYFMADNAYARLVGMLAQNQFQSVSPELRASILAYYSDANAPIATRKHAGDWARLTRQLEQLKSAATSAESAAPAAANP